MDSSDDDSSSSSDCASDLTSVAKPLSLDPDTVRALAASTGCQELMIDEQSQSIYLNANIRRRSKSSLSYATITSSNGSSLSFDTTQTASEDEEDLIFPRRIRNTCSGEVEVEVEHGNSSLQHQKESLRETEHILSFLASDPLSVEQLAAEADNGEKKKRNELDGSGIARVDVYCLSGTVIVSRMLLALKNDLTLPERYDDEGGPRNSTAIVSSTKARKSENTQVRRMIRQKVTQSHLRCIFSNPPKATTIDESISASYDKDVMKEKLSEEYQLAHDEMARMQVANAIINTAKIGVGGDDLERVMQLDAFDCTPLDADKTSKLIPDENDELQSLQIEVREKIEIADIGLAMLMEEKQQLEKLMGIEKEVKKNHEAYESLERNSVIRDEGDDDNDSVESKSCHDEEEERAYESRSERIRMMGCEVEYSFATVLVDDLEAALMGKSTNDDDSSDSDYSCNDLCRGRSKTKRTILPGEIVPLKRQLRLSAIAAIPTNGDGCVVMRENGAFNVVGHIPKLLEEQLFHDDAPFPEYISLGSNDRYFVKFVDESYYVHGSNSLTRTLNGKMTEKQKAKRKKRANNKLSIASVAFGKESDAFFVVFSDGSWECDGGLHDELDKLLTDRGNRADLVWVSLGPNDEFCFKAKNGRIWWGGVSEEIGELLFDITDGNEEVNYISFGVDGSFFLNHRH